MNPVYDIAGTFLGCTSEGFTGMIMIYTGTELIDPTKYSLSELQSSAGKDLMTYDEARQSTEIKMQQGAHSLRWTHIVSQFEGTQIYDEVFSMSDLSEGKIGFETDSDASWTTLFYINSNEIPPKITGTGNYNYESTVENIASSVIVHE